MTWQPPTSPPWQRHAILHSLLTELTGFVLVVDCRGARCGGERSCALTALAACYSPGMTVGVVFAPDAVRPRLWGRPLATWLGTGPVLSERIRPHPPFRHVGECRSFKPVPQVTAKKVAEQSYFIRKVAPEHIGS